MIAFLNSVLATLNLASPYARAQFAVWMLTGMKQSEQQVSRHPWVTPQGYIKTDPATLQAIQGSSNSFQCSNFISQQLNAISDRQARAFYLARAFIMGRWKAPSGPTQLRSDVIRWHTNQLLLRSRIAVENPQVAPQPVYAAAPAAPQYAAAPAAPQYAAAPAGPQYAAAPAQTNYAAAPALGGNYAAAPAAQGQYGQLQLQPANQYGQLQLLSQYDQVNLNNNNYDRVIMPNQPAPNPYGGMDDPLINDGCESASSPLSF